MTKLFGRAVAASTSRFFLAGADSILPHRGLLLLLLLLAWPVHSEVTLKVPGGETALLENLRAHLALLSEPCDAPAWRVERLFKRAEKDLDPALRAFGYYRTQIEKKLERSGACWHAELSIDLGKRVTVRRRSVVVKGAAASDPALQPLLSKLPLAEGEPLNHGQYEEIKRQLQDFALERGYLDFTFTDKALRVDPEEAAAEIEIAAESGPRYRFGELRFSQQPLLDGFVHRLANIKEGDLYEARALKELDRNLSDAGYYQHVEVQLRRDQAADGQIPVDIDLTPAARHAWRAGVGFATDTGPRTSFGYNNRYINPRGHRFESELRLSPVESGLTADYIIPGENPHRENFSLGARMLHETSDGILSDSASLIAKQTLQSERWTQSRFIELLYEQSDVGDDSSTALLLMPGINFERIKADNPLRTRKGYRLSAEMRAAYEGLLSTSSFVQLRASAKGIYRFGEGGRVTGRIGLGATLGDGIGNLPASLRFFAGGDNSVRGYEYKSLGPKDADGDPEGGRHLFTGSLEYEHPIAGDDWWLAAFADIGNALNTRELELKQGYGTGVRWYSPIGRLRLDLAFPSDKSSDDWRIHFGLGADL